MQLTTGTNETYDTAYVDGRGRMRTKAFATPLARAGWIRRQEESGDIIAITGTRNPDTDPPAETATSATEQRALEYVQIGDTLDVSQLVAAKGDKKEHRRHWQIVVTEIAGDGHAFYFAGWGSKPSDAPMSAHRGQRMYEISTTTHRIVPVCAR